MAAFEQHELVLNLLGAFNYILPIFLSDEQALDATVVVIRRSVDELGLLAVGHFEHPDGKLTGAEKDGEL